MIQGEEFETYVQLMPDKNEVPVWLNAAHELGFIVGDVVESPTSGKIDELSQGYASRVVLEHKAAAPHIPFGVIYEQHGERLRQFAKKCVKAGGALIRLTYSSDMDIDDLRRRVDELS